MGDQKTPIVVQLACTKCTTTTNHRIAASVKKEGRSNVDDEYFAWEDHYEVVECLGCETVSFRHVHSDSEQFDGDAGYYSTVAVYPNRLEGRRALEHTLSLPLSVRRIYLETHRSLVAGMPVLTGIGIRAIIESVSENLNADGANLQQKIDDMASKGLITSNGTEILHKLRVLGNDAAHEVKPHTMEQLTLAIEVVEHLLEGAYIFPERSEATFK